MFCFCPLCFIFYGSYVKKNQIQIIDFGRILHIRIVVSFAEFLRGTSKISLYISCIFFVFADYFISSVHRSCFIWPQTTVCFYVTVCVYILAFVVFNGVVVVVFGCVCSFGRYSLLCFCWNSCTGKNLTEKPVASLCRDSPFSLFPSLSFSNTLDTTPTTVCVHSI